MKGVSRAILIESVFLGFIEICLIIYLKSDFEKERNIN